MRFVRAHIRAVRGFTEAIIDLVTSRIPLPLIQRERISAYGERSYALPLQSFGAFLYACVQIPEDLVSQYYARTVEK